MAGSRRARGQGTDERQRIVIAIRYKRTRRIRYFCGRLHSFQQQFKTTCVYHVLFFPPSSFFSPPLPLYPLFSFSWGGCPWAALTIVASRPPKGPPPPSPLSPLKRSPTPPLPLLIRLLLIRATRQASSNPLALVSRYNVAPPPLLLSLYAVKISSSRPRVIPHDSPAPIAKGALLRIGSLGADRPRDSAVLWRPEGALFTANNLSRRGLPPDPPNKGRKKTKGEKKAKEKGREN